MKPLSSVIILSLLFLIPNLAQAGRFPNLNPAQSVTLPDDSGKRLAFDDGMVYGATTVSSGYLNGFMERVHQNHCSRAVSHRHYAPMPTSSSVSQQRKNKRRDNHWPQLT